MRHTTIPAALALFLAAAPASAQCTLDDLQPGGLPAGAEFGHSVAIDGDSMFVGAPFASASGVVYWYRRTSPTEWTLEGSFPGSASGGRAVAVDGQWAAYSTGGGVQLLQRSGPQTWSYSDLLTGASIQYGDALAIEDGATPRVVVGMPGAAFTDADPEVWMFNGATWVLEHTFAPIDGDYDRYAHDVAIDDPYVLISSPEDDDAGLGAGSVHVYYRSGGGTWVESQELLPTWAGVQNFGWAIDAADDGLIVGAPNSNPLKYSLWRRVGGFYQLDAQSQVNDAEGGTAVAIDGDLAVIHADASGARMIERDPGTGIWSFHGFVSGSAGFGRSVDLDGGLLAVGHPALAQGHAYAATFLQDDCNGNGIEDLCEIAAGTRTDYNQDGVPDDCHTGDLTCGCGAGDAPCGNPGGQGTGCRNSTGLGAALIATGSTSVAMQPSDRLVLSVYQAPPNKTGLWLQGANGQQVPFRDGNLCVANPTIRLPGPTCGVSPQTIGGDGAISTADAGQGFRLLDVLLCKGDDIAAQAPATRYYQFWYRDAMGPCGTGSNLSNSVKIGWTP